MLFFLSIKVEMPTIVGISTFMSRKNFILSWVEHEKSSIASGLCLRVNGHTFREGYCAIFIFATLPDEVNS